MKLCLDTGKRGFGDRHAARKALVRFGQRVRIYRCPRCGLYHVTSMTVERGDGRGRAT